MRTSRGLTLSRVEDEKSDQKSTPVREIEVSIPSCEPFETSRLKLTVLAELPPKKDSSSMEHKVSLFKINQSINRYKKKELCIFTTPSDL